MTGIQQAVAGSGGEPPITLVLASNGTNNSPTSTTTLASVAFSTTGARTLVFCLSGERSTTAIVVTSVTIGGVSAPQRVATTSYAGSGGTLGGAFIFSASVPTGATGDIVIVFGTLPSEITWALYAIYDATSAVPTRTASNESAGASVLSSAVTPTKTNNVTIAHVGTTVKQSTTWTGVTEVTDDFSATSSSGSSGTATNSPLSLLTAEATVGTSGGMGVVVAQWEK